jgi:predicted MPP superfamily phosphohydrolase
VRRAMAFEPHLIVLPGDLIQIANRERYLAAAPQFRELLAPLSAPLGVYFVIGNTDTPSLVRHALEGTNVKLLVDEIAEVEFAGKRVLIGGANIEHWSHDGGSPFSREFDRRESDELRILVCHYPSCVEEAQPTQPGFDLAIAGHTHGGQVVIPGFGPPITLTSVPRAAAAGGLHVVNGRQLYVSRGVGLERGSAPRLRFLCPPEVSLLTLRAAD